jgi:large subunit ribosomal protein L9
MKMKVVFLEDVEGVALGGEIKEVKNGFARNYLIPQQLAAPATHNNLQKITKLSRKAETERIQKLDDMKQLSEAIDGTEILIEMRAGSNDRLYGSVTGTMVADALNDITGQSIERRLVQLDNPIRELGSFDVPIRLHADVNATIKVTVTSGDAVELEDDLEDPGQEQIAPEAESDNLSTDVIASGEDAVEESGTAETVISEPESSVEEPDKEQ